MIATSSPPVVSLHKSKQTLWVAVAAIGLPTGFALCLYWLSAAPGLTWAHHGADGGDFLAAAMVNGVPHPSGYPFYTLLLRAWLGLGQLLYRQLGLELDIAYWGNRLSALCAAGATGFTVAATASLLYNSSPLYNHRERWLWAMVAGLLFAITPLVWSQALITEVYALHTLLIAVMGWAVMEWAALPSPRPHSSTQVTPNHQPHRKPNLRQILLGLLMGLGAAHHLTSLLLWPALLNWQLHPLPRRAWLGAAYRMVGIALVVALLFYTSLLWRVAAATPPPPIAWGYPRDAAGLWWLLGGDAYRAYLFSMTPLQYAGRLASLARILVEQFTPLGLAVVIFGFAVWDRQRPVLRLGAIVWMLPISLYAAGYNTVDSYVYLLPVVWLMSLMLGQGGASVSHWMAATVWRDRPAAKVWLGALATVALITLATLVFWRLPQLDLRGDRAAQEFLEAAATTLEPNSLVISSADEPTFALWYGEWGSGELASSVPNLIYVNYALYQFGWYRNLMHDLYPEVPNMGASFAELLAANRSLRPIYFTEPLPGVPQAELISTGAFWRLTSPRNKP